MSRVLVEGCVTSAAEARACFAAGARRVEICSHLEVGGVTPPAALTAATIGVAAGPVVVLVRPAAGGFRLGAAEAAHLVGEVARVADSGVQGIVAGALDLRGRIDEGLVAELVRAAGGLPVTFHRAFDEVTDPVAGVEDLMRAGIARVLTSGGAPTAWEGRAVLRPLVEAAGDALTVVGGGSVRADHARRLVDETGVLEVHARASAVPELVAALV